MILAVCLAIAASAFSGRGGEAKSVSHGTDTPIVMKAGGTNVVVPAGVSAAARYSYSTFPVGTSSIKVVIVSTPTARPQSTLDQINTVMAEVAALYARWSGGKLSMTHVVEEKSVPSVECGSPATTDADLNGFDHIVEYIPLTTCGWAGLGTLGGSWVQVVGDGFSSRVVAHELGHNLGLSHSMSAKCTDTITAWTLCAKEEYGDHVEVMGGGSDTLGAIGRTMLDWHDPASIKVDVQGEIDLAESPAALVLTDPAGGGEYWFEYYRSSTLSSLPTDQVLVRRVPVADYGRSSRSSLFDRGRTKTYDFARQTWVVDTGFSAGETFVDPTGQIRVEILSVGATARLRVTSPPRPPAPVWRIDYSRYSSSRAQVEIERPKQQSHTQSIDITVWNVDGTSTTSRQKPSYFGFDVKNSQSVAAVTVAMRELDGTGPTSAIVLKKNDRVPAAATATAVSDGVRIVAVDPKRHSRLRVTCAYGAIREFNDLTKAVTVRGIGKTSSCLARLQSLTGDVVTDEQMVLLPTVKGSKWVTVDANITNNDDPATNRTTISIQRSCIRCPRTTIVVQRFVNSKWVTTKKLATTRNYWSVTTKKNSPLWRVKVGSTLYTPMIPN